MVLISIGCLLAAKAEASSLEISPVMIMLAPGQTTATITVQNRGDAPAAVQVRAYSWGQRGDDDPLIPTSDIILSPPIFAIPQGSSQVLRLLLRGGGAKGERSYRLMLDEVPPADADRKQVVMALRVSLPVVVESTSSTLPALKWRAERLSGGGVVLTAVNAGDVYDRVIAMDVTLPDGSHPKLLARSANTYVLPGAQRHWSVGAGGPAPAGPLRLSVTTRAGKSAYTLSP